MVFKQAVSSRVLELCKEHHYTPNKLAELSTIFPTTLNPTYSLTYLSKIQSGKIFKIYTKDSSNSFLEILLICFNVFYYFNL